MLLVQNKAWMDRLSPFLDSLDGGAWPLLVGGVICLADPVNERDQRLSLFAGLVFGRGMLVRLRLVWWP